MPIPVVLVVGAKIRFDETPSPTSLVLGQTTSEHAANEKVLDWVRQAHRPRSDRSVLLRVRYPRRGRGYWRDKRGTSHWAACRVEGDGRHGGWDERMCTRRIVKWRECRRE